MADQDRLDQRVPRGQYRPGQRIGFFRGDDGGGNRRQRFGQLEQPVEMRVPLHRQPRHVAGIEPDQGFRCDHLGPALDHTAAIGVFDPGIKRDLAARALGRQTHLGGQCVTRPCAPDKAQVLRVIQRTRSRQLAAQHARDQRGDPHAGRESLPVCRRHRHPRRADAGGFRLPEELAKTYRSSARHSRVCSACMPTVSASNGVFCMGAPAGVGVDPLGIGFQRAVPERRLSYVTGFW